MSATPDSTLADPQTAHSRSATAACRVQSRARRSAGAADRDRRGVAGHQCLARRPRAGVRCDIGEGTRACAGRAKARCLSRTVSNSGSVAMRGVPDRSPSGCGAALVVPTRCRLSRCWPVNVSSTYRTWRRMTHPGSPRRIGRTWRRPYAAVGALAEKWRAARDDYVAAERGPAVHRKADRAVGEFRGAGGHRDGERAADHRDARGLEQQTATAEVLGSSTPRPATSPLFSTRCWRRRCACAGRRLGRSLRYDGECFRLRGDARHAARAA